VSQVPPSEIELASGIRRLTTSRGVRVRFSFLAWADTAEATPGHLTGPGTVDVTVASANGHESHSWQLPIGAGVFSVSAHGGSLRTGSKLAPFGRFRVHETPTGTAGQAHCTGGADYATRSVRLRGTVAFTTRTDAWGQVSTGTHPFRFARGSRLIRYQGISDPQNFCHTPLPACASTVSWGVGGVTAAVFLSGTAQAGKKHALLHASQVQQLSRPQGSRRIDVATAQTPRPRLTASHGSARIVVRTSGHGARGSATLTSTTTRSTDPQPCGPKGQRRSPTTLWDAEFSNGPRPLRIHEAIEGTFHVRSHNPLGAIERSRRH
jgi:hypothetical protein